MTADYQRTRARVIRAGDATTHLSIPAWQHGQILVPVLTHRVTDATGLEREELPGTDLTVNANLAAVTEAEVGAHGFEVAVTYGVSRAARRQALSAAA